MSGCFRLVSLKGKVKRLRKFHLPSHEAQAKVRLDGLEPFFRGRSFLCARFQFQFLPFLGLVSKSAQQETTLVLWGCLPLRDKQHLSHNLICLLGLYYICFAALHLGFTLRGMLQGSEEALMHVALSRRSRMELCGCWRPCPMARARGICSGSWPTSSRFSVNGICNIHSRCNIGCVPAIVFEGSGFGRRKSSTRHHAFRVHRCNLTSLELKA